MTLTMHEPAPTPTTPLTATQDGKRMEAAIRAALHPYGWPAAGGGWSMDLIGDLTAGVVRVRNGTRIADVSVNGDAAWLGPITIYQWQARPMYADGPELAPQVELNAAIEAACPASHQDVIGIWYIGERKAQLRGMVHCGRVFWQRV